MLRAPSDQGVVPPIRTTLMAKTGVKKFRPSFLLFDRLTALQNGYWPFDHTGNLPLTIDYMHILSFDPITYNIIQKKAKQLHPFLSVRVKMPVLAVNMVHMGGPSLADPSEARLHGSGSGLGDM